MPTAGFCFLPFPAYRNSSPTARSHSDCFFGIFPAVKIGNPKIYIVCVSSAIPSWSRCECWPPSFASTSATRHQTISKHPTSLAQARALADLDGDLDLANPPQGPILHGFMHTRSLARRVQGCRLRCRPTKMKRHATLGKIIYIVSRSDAELPW